MRLDAADRSAIAAYLDRVDPGLIQQLTDGNALRFIQTSEDEITGIDLDRDMERRGYLTDASIISNRILLRFSVVPPYSSVL